MTREERLERALRDVHLREFGSGLCWCRPGALVVGTQLSHTAECLAARSALASPAAAEPGEREASLPTAIEWYQRGWSEGQDAMQEECALAAVNPRDKSIIRSIRPWTAPAAPPTAATPPEDRPWGKLPEIDSDPDARMCGVMNGNIICCRSQGHTGRHATPFPSFRRHGPVWVYWGGPPLGPFGSCHAADPATRLYCGLEKDHEGDHLAPTNERSGKTLAEWAAPSPPPAAGPGAQPEAPACRERHPVSGKPCILVMVHTLNEHDGTINHWTGQCCGGSWTTPRAPAEGAKP